MSSPDEIPVVSEQPLDEAHLLKIADDLAVAMQALLDRDVDLRTSLEVIVWSMRLHSMSVLAMERILQQEGVDAAAKILLREAARKRVLSQYYTRADAISAIENIMLPFARAEAAVEIEQERTNRLESDSAARAHGKPPLPLRVGGMSIEAARGRVALFVGDPVKTLKCVADLILDTLNANLVVKVTGEEPSMSQPKHNLINLSAMESPPQISQHEPRVFRVPLSKWRHIANSRTKMEKILSMVAGTLIDSTCDLIVVDNGTLLHQGIVGRDLAREVEDGIKALRKTAAKLGAAAICFVPLPPDQLKHRPVIKCLMENHTDYYELD